MYKVLIFARDTAWNGGVANFIELLKRDLPNEIEAKKFKIGRRKKASFGGISHYLMPLIDSVRLFYFVLLERYDAYHINPSLDPKSVIRDGLFSLILRLVKAKNVIVAFHGWSLSTQKMINGSFVLKSFFRIAFGGATKYLVLAAPFKEWLVEQGIPQEKILIYTTMFDGKSFTGLKRRVVGNGVCLIFLSRLVREKGIYELLEAFQLLGLHHSDLRLVIAGNGPEEERIRNWVENRKMEDRVEMTGYIRGKEKILALLNSDIFVLPSYSEGCPVSLLEAMAAGLPVVTTAVGGIPQIIIEGQNGFLLYQGTPEMIANAVTKLLNDKPLRLKIGGNNRHEAWKKYDGAIVAQLFYALYRGEEASA